MVFLTGANGYVGRHVLETFVSRKIKVIALVRNKESLNSLKEKFPKVKFVLGDLENVDVLNSAIKGEKVVIHLAASVHGKKEDMIKSNVDGLRNLILVCKKNKVKRIIFLSSMAVKRPFVDDYALTKIKGEEMLLGCGIDCVILRPTIIFGGDDEGSFKKAVNQINMFPFFVPIFGNGKYTLAPVNVDDVSKAVFFASAVDFHEKGVYEIGGKVINFNEFISILKKRYNIKKMTLHIPLFVGRFAVWVLGKVLKNPPLTKEAFINATTSSSVDKTSFFRAFGFETRGFGEF